MFILESKSSRFYYFLLHSYSTKCSGYKIECLDKVQLSAVYVLYICMQQNTAEYSSTYVPYHLPLALQVRINNPPVPTGLILVCKTQKAKEKFPFVLTCVTE